MNHWSVHLAIRVLAIIAGCFIFNFMFSGDGSSDAMGDGMQAGFAFIFAYLVTAVIALIFLSIEALRLFRRDETAKVACNISIIAILLALPAILLIQE